LPPPFSGGFFANSSWNAWSGAYLTNPAAQFSHIQADWNVPAVVADANTPIFSAVAEWIGLGHSETDLFQAGSWAICINIPAFETPDFYFPAWTITNYWMWIESLPWSEWAVPNLRAYPGDNVSIDIFVADQNGQTWYQNGSNGGLIPADNSVWFMLYNNTQGLSYWGTLPTSPQTIGGLSSTGFTGSTAEFIVERPSYNNTPVPLANFVFTGMQNA
jgi:hypothetical protein